MAQLHKAATPLILTSRACQSGLRTISKIFINMQEYKHRRIDTKSSEFRLLRVEKSLDERSPINITRRHAQLNEEEGLFNALSYAWGNESPTYKVHIDDGVTNGSFHVRQNLYDFLCTVRKMTNDLTEWIWIDQICIDQNHHDEKCHQVSQMGQLYSNARSTVSWPGRLRTVWDSSDDPSGLTPSANDFELFIHDVEEEIPIGWRSVAEILQLAKGMLHDLLLSPYWSRAWIVQEIALARNRQVLMNDALWEFDTLCDATDWLNQYFSQSKLPRFKIMMKRNYLLNSRLGFIQIFHPNERTTSWKNVFPRFTHTKCLVPFDRVYASMGLLHKSLRFQPDYDISEKELLRRVLLREFAVQFERFRIRFSYLINIIREWSRTMLFEPIRPLGWLPFDRVWTSKMEYLSWAQHNVLLVFRELGIQVPSKLPPYPRVRSRPWWKERGQTRQQSDRSRSSRASSAPVASRGHEMIAGQDEIFTNLSDQD